MCGNNMHRYLLQISLHTFANAKASISNINTVQEEHIKKVCADNICICN
jgi:hypothetical protein